MPLPDFTRLAWASAAAQAVWEPRVRRISHALLDMEIQSVRDGVRPVALQFTPDVASLRRLDGLAFAPVAAGRCAVAKDHATVDAFVAAWHGRDDVTVGRFLGFPTCCTAFFDDVWNTRGLRDTTLAMADAQTTAMGCNILGRWLGVRLVPHLPCGWACARTATFARALAPCWDPEALAWADEMLAWPVEYSALHGIAIVTFPVVKIVTNTDYTAGARVIQRQGTRYPVEAASGLKFPFQKPRVQTLSLQMPTPKPVDPRRWTDNGFPSKASMDAAHDMVLKAIGPQLSFGKVIDLGCGNGLLLEKITGVLKVGIEADASRAAQARPGVDIRVGRIQDVARLVPETFGLGLISQRRLEEFTTAERATFATWAATHVTELLVYSYDAPMFTRMERPVCVA